MGRLSFSGPYTMPKGASGRVPPTKGGSATSAPMGAPKGVNYPFRIPRNYGDGLTRGTKYWPGFASSLANTDPYKTVGLSRMADAFLTNFLDNDQGMWGSLGGSDAARQLTIPPGWTIVLACAGKLVQRVWGVGDTASCASVRTFANEGQYSTGTFGGQPARFIYFTPSVPQTIYTNVFPRDGGARWVGPSFANFKMPYIKALPLPLVGFAPAVEDLIAVDQAAGRAAGRISIGTAFSFDSEAGTGSRSPVPPSNPAPPGNGAKERKFQLGKGGAAGNVFGALTEADDAMECAVKAIKGNGGPSAPHMGFKEKAAYIAKNFKLSNGGMVDDFISCMVVNNAQDFAIGKANSVAGRAFGKASGSPRGVGIKRGPSPF